MKRWTSQEVLFLKENYSKMGSEQCAIILQEPLKKVRSKIRKLGLMLLPETKAKIQKQNSLKQKPKQQKDHNVHIDLFSKKFTHESAYILGFLWADGYLNSNYSISTEALRIDLEEIYPHFLKTGAWKIRYRNRSDRRPSAIISTSNKTMSSFLKEHNYGPKNYGSATILELIPKHLHYMWFRGIVDGDGCWYLNQKNHLRQFSIAGAYDQDWSFIEKKFLSLGIKHKTARRTQQRKEKKDTRSSIIRVTGKDNLLKLGEFMYHGAETDKVGLTRKLNKWILIRDSYRNRDDQQVDIFESSSPSLIENTK